MLSSRRLAVLAAAALAACTHATAPAAPRVLVSTSADWLDPAAFAARAAQVAGVPVRDVAAVSPRLYALTLDCPDAPACAAARSRLAADRSFAQRVSDDARVPSPTQPASSSAR
jgi:hypothetical protein